MQYKYLSAGIETVMNLTVLGIIAQADTERLDISLDYNAIKGKESAVFDFKTNLMVPPGGASISFAPKGLGKQQWVTNKGSIKYFDLNELNNTVSGKFEGTLIQLLDDKGGFVLSTPKPEIQISGEFKNIKFVKVNKD
jgi:hypothetical protein